MKHRIKQLKSRRKFQIDFEKQYVKKIRVYPTFLYGYLDNWLKKMSLRGWHIVHCGVFLFWFEKGEPIEKEYFTYGLSTQEGKYSLSLRYPFLEKTYGLSKKKSKINANESKRYQILEIDTNKIDIANDCGYKEMISDRNRLYMRYFVRNFIISTIVLAFLLSVLLFL